MIYNLYTYIYIYCIRISKDQDASKRTALLLRNTRQGFVQLRILANHQMSICNSSGFHLQKEPWKQTSGDPRSNKKVASMYIYISTYSTNMVSKKPKPQSSNGQVPRYTSYHHIHLHHFYIYAHTQREDHWFLGWLVPRYETAALQPSCSTSWVHWVSSTSCRKFSAIFIIQVPGRYATCSSVLLQLWKSTVYSFHCWRLFWVSNKELWAEQQRFSPRLKQTSAITLPPMISCRIAR